MRKKIIILLGTLLLVVAGGLGLAIRAWLTDENEIEGSVITVGKVKFSFEGNIISSGYVVPGQNLVTTPFVLTNQSNVGTELRVKIDATYGSSNTNAISYILLGFGESNGWELKADGYYYYKGSSSTLTSGKNIILAGSQSIQFINNIKLDGSKVGNAFSNEIFKFTFTFQAKQSDYVTWAEMESIDFTTGLNQA